MQTQVSPMTNRKPGRFGVLLCIFLLVGFVLSFLGQPVQAQPPLAITIISLPEATAGSPYTATLTATGGMPPYVWAITAGALPPGLSLDSATGVISGVPPHGAVGTHGFTVTVTDMHGNMASNPFSITVKGFYTATVTIGMSLLQLCQTMVYVDGEPAGGLKGGESLTLSFPFGTTHTVDVDPLVADPGNKDRRFKAVDVALTVTEASPNAVFQYVAEYSVSYKAEPLGIVGLPSSDWYPEGSMLTASTTEVVDEPPGTQYRFAHWQLPTGETMAGPQLSVTVERGGEIVAYFDTFYLLTVFSEYGTTKGSEYYKADTRASWSVTPAEVEMSGVLGFLGGKMRAKNPEGIEVITSPKTVTISWQPDYKMPILISTLVLLFIGLGSYLGYRYAQMKGGAKGEAKTCGAPCDRCKKGACSKPPDHDGPCNSEHELCGEKKICKNCDGEIAQCSLCKDGHTVHNFSPSEHELCGEKKVCSFCEKQIQCSLCKGTHGNAHNFPAHPCGKFYNCKCGAKKVACTTPCNFKSHTHSGPHTCGQSYTCTSCHATLKCDAPCHGADGKCSNSKHKCPKK
jgi:hypothetical protein